MAIQGQISVEFGAVFPDGAYAAGAIEMVRDFDRSSGDRVVQQTDKHTGLPLWVVEVIDAAGERPAADGQGEDRRAGPAGAAAPGARLAVHPGRVRRHDRHPVRGCVPLHRATASTSAAPARRTRFKATGVRAPSRGIGRPAPEHKDAA